MKAPAQLEYRALQILEALSSGRPVSEADPLSAVFGSWPAAGSATARRLAAHANTARGRDLLWLIGAAPDSSDDRARAIDIARLEPWLAALIPYFDGLAPRITAFPIPAGLTHVKRTVVALLIETGRAPFVVRRTLAPRTHAESKPVAWEVPWLDSDGDLVRSARRLELVKLLAPLADLPGLEVLEAELSFYKNPHTALGSKTHYRWTLDGSLYIVPHGDARLVIPLHRCRASVAIPEAGFSSEANDCNFTADKSSPAIRVTETALLVEGLGRFFVYACGATGSSTLPWKSPAFVRMDLSPTSTERCATAATELHPDIATEANQAGRWRL